MKPEQAQRVIALLSRAIASDYLPHTVKDIQTGEQTTYSGSLTISSLTPGRTFEVTEYGLEGTIKIWIKTSGTILDVEYKEPSNQIKIMYAGTRVSQARDERNSKYYHDVDAQGSTVTLRGDAEYRFAVT